MLEHNRLTSELVVDLLEVEEHLKSEEEEEPHHQERQFIWELEEVEEVEVAGNPHISRLPQLEPELRLWEERQWPHHQLLVEVRQQ